MFETLSEVEIPDLGDGVERPGAGAEGECGGGEGGLG